MSNARKLQTEIDRVLKKVDEGTELFDETWAKVYSAEQQNQKEKYELDLKKEIKKLQRLRDQIKTWIGSSDVKDKDALIDYRKLIETKMEQFKICEKETKTKTYSKVGLAREEKLDPAEEAKRDCTQWIAEYIEKLNQLVEDRDVEIERLSAGKGKKTNKHVIEEYNQFIVNHKFHINKLEGIMRLVNNDRLDVESVNEVKDDLEYYIDAYEDDEYIQSYDEEMFYESLGLDDLDVVNVDRVTQVSTTHKGKSVQDDASAGSATKKKEKVSKKSSTASSMIPLKIGRATTNPGSGTISSSASANGVSSTGSSEKEKPTSTTPTKRSSQPIPSSVTTQQPGPPVSAPALGPAPTTRAPPPAQAGASMAAILKREGEQQEKERQQKAALQQAQQQQLQRQQQEALKLQEAHRRQQQQQQAEALRQQEVLRQQAVQAQQKAAQQEALKRQQQEAAAKQQQQLEQQRQQEAAHQHQQAAVENHQLERQRQQQEVLQLNMQHLSRLGAAQSQTPGTGQGAIDNLLTSGLGGLSLGNAEPTAANASPVVSSSAVSPQQHRTGAMSSASGTTIATVASTGTSVSIPHDATASYLGALNESFLHIPSSADSERQRTYTPRNPYPTPSSYPSLPSQIFDNPAVFEKMGLDCLFFIFYYAQGTYQQYLAARELKKQSWRYHKKYMTWFQRHEEPKVTTDEYEQGTYVYFDYETGWCQRIKADFRFEYSFLEDSLSI